MPEPQQPDPVGGPQVTSNGVMKDYQYRFANCDRKRERCARLHNVEKQFRRVMKFMSQHVKHMDKCKRYVTSDIFESPMSIVIVLHSPAANSDNP
ncbi:hypothetical protein EV182_001695, partial [Spiromyces aspiralis]